MPLVEGQWASAHEVQARWAYSELRSSRTLPFYRQYPLDGLDEMASSSVDFEALLPAQRNRLVDLVRRVRGGLPEIVDLHDTYVLENWTKGRLCQAFTVSHFNTPAQRHHLPYFDFLHWERDNGPGGTTDPFDPRVIAESIPTGAGAVKDWGAIGVGKFPNVLVDGYLRSVLFMRDAPQRATLPVWVALDTATWRAAITTSDD